MEKIEPKRIDELGRLVIPRQIRRKLDVENGESIDFYVDGDRVFLMKHTPCCFFCRKTEGLTFLMEDKAICEDCIAKAKELH